MDLASVKELTEMMRNKSGPLVGANDGWLERIGEAHLGGDVGGEVGE